MLVEKQREREKERGRELSSRVRQQREINNPSFLMPRYRASSRLYNAAGAPYVRWYRRISYGLAASKVSASKYKLPRWATTLDVPPQRRDNIFVHIARLLFPLPLILSLSFPFHNPFALAPVPVDRPQASLRSGYLSSRHHLPSINPRGRLCRIDIPPLPLHFSPHPLLYSRPSSRIEFAIAFIQTRYSTFIPINNIGINVNVQI